MKRGGGEGLIWLPGQGPDQAALARLRRPRPKEAMGEAWFMGSERRMFTELLGDLSSLSLRELKLPLEELASGTRCFGHFREWDDWYHFLLGELLPRSEEEDGESLLEYLLTGFFSLYLHGIEAVPYRHFAEDVLLTLGRCLMKPQHWHDGDMAVSMPCSAADGLSPLWRDWDGCKDIYASMFFCLKYLPHEQLEAWLRSVCAIRSPYWRAQIMAWLVGAHGLLADEIFWPSEFPEAAWPCVDWAWSHCLKPEPGTPRQSASTAVPEGAFLPHGSRHAALSFIRDYFSETMYLQWLADIGERPDIAKAMYDIPQRFESLYLNRA